MLNEQEFTLVTNSVHYSVLANVSTTVVGQFNDLCKKVEKLNRTVLQEVMLQEDAQNIIMAELRAINETLNMLKLFSPGYKCGILGNWHRIAYFDTSQGDSCPTGLRTVTNTNTKQTACGRTVNRGCTSLQFSSNGIYTNVCGRVRGYQNYEPEAFIGTSSIDSPYLHGVSITHGTPRTHLWSYVAGRSERYSNTDHRCPCARPDPTDRSGVPSLVGEDFYCESGFSGSKEENRIAWEDPLWDGQGWTGMLFFW